MPARRMRIELFDREGNRYTISFEGRVTRDKAVRLLDLVELLGGVPNEGGSPDLGASAGELTKYDRIQMVVRNCFPVVWFTSNEVQSVYEREMKEPIGLSTVSTYLSRMAERGVLVKTKASRQSKYRLARSVPSEAIKRRIP